MTTIYLVRVLQLVCLFLRCHSAILPKFQAIVYPELFDARDDEDTRVVRINDDITLNLKPSAVLHPEFFLRTYRQGVPQHTYFNIEALEQNLYDDEKHFAAVILTEEDGTLQLKGVVGPNLKIMPAMGMERSEDGRHPHILETIHDTDSDHVYGKLPEEGLNKISARSLKFDATAYSIDTVYPEVFIVCDSEFYREFKDEQDMLFYLMVELKVVNLRYRTVSNPKIVPVYRGVEITDYRREHKYYHYIGAGIDCSEITLLNCGLRERKQRKLRFIRPGLLRNRERYDCRRRLEARERTSRLRLCRICLHREASAARRRQSL
ncbi:uncharacterized protein LOC119465283 [Dermacentor silvarum]|uniref:uncharacterized protein LOC119465283 n=1 Tax=Dermacentor silvarum TaxID=543639 RepID=UPI00189B33F1|nr:uncharacterized protein LOC119465283 [Dermacentor silvarum]